MHSEVQEEVLLKHYKNIKNSIISTCQRVSRDPKKIHLIAVSKTRTIDQMKMIENCGLSLFGENKVQEVLEKQTFFEDPKRELHFIGHLQTNKVNKILPLAKVIHSVDSLKLLDKIHTYCENYKQERSVFLQVNIANEKTKYGFSSANLNAIVQDLKNSQYLNYIGLMNIAPRVEDANQNRVVFSEMKKILNEIQQKSSMKNAFNFLSMGMSQDYEVAIEEGSDYIRLGTVLFNTKV